MMMRVVIADDEPLVRERVRTLLGERTDVTVIAECADGAAALVAMQDLEPDLVLLDVQMPELDGFEALDALPAEQRPAIIFITAYDEYAVRAFEFNAADYLVKPIEPARFHAALDRARSRSAAVPRGADPELTALLREIQALRGYGERLAARDGDRVTFIAVADIERIDAAGNYVRVRTPGRSVLMREPLKTVEARLDPRHFIRIHRSTIVSIRAIAHVEPHFHGEYVVTLRDGTRVTSSRSYSERLRALMK